MLQTLPTHEILADPTAEPQTTALVVINPVSGNRDPQETLRIVHETFGAADWQVVVYETTGKEALAAVVREQCEAHAPDLVVVCGGDGTISATASGLFESGIPLGIVPTGSANVLALQLDIPLNTQQACQLIVAAPHIAHIDSMQVAEQHYLVSINLGMSALTMRNTSREQKRVLGKFAYVIHAFREMIAARNEPVTISIDEAVSFTRAVEVAVTNTAILGSKPFRWGDHIRYDDGVVDVCLVRARSFLTMLKAALMLALGQERALQEVHCQRAKERVRIASAKPLPVQADGESIGTLPVEVIVHPHAIAVITGGESAQPD